MATIEGKMEAIEWLLEKGADPSLEDSAGYLPLHYAAAEGHMSILGKLSLISDVMPLSPGSGSRV
jgi:ankyrin repeat protein